MDFVNTLRTFTPSYYDEEDFESANVILIDRKINEIMGDETRNNNDSDAYLLDTSYPSSDVSNFILELTASTISVMGNRSGSNFSTSKSNNESGYRDPLSIILPISICYILIFIAGVLGNVITCVVIATNKTMHTATNYYLFNLAVSDSLILLFGMPFDFISIWLPNSYPFDEIVCILQGLMSETSTNATILTITSFTCERYVAICHPFRSHTMSKLSRVIKFIFAIWILAFLLAAPQAFQFGLVHSNNSSFTTCTVKNQFVEHAFEVSSFVFFIVPMTVICVLYILIGIKLRQSKLLYGKKVKSSDSQRYIKGQSRVVRMLVVVVVTFFLCWAPFHAQRIMAVYGKIMKKSFSKDDLFMRIYVALTYISGISYFLSTCINPVLYNIMSHKFRNASKLTLFVHCFNRSPSPQKAAPTSSNYSGGGLSLKYGVGETHDDFNLDGVNKIPRKFFIFPKSKKHKTSHEIFQLKNERKEIDKVKKDFENVRQTLCLSEEWALERFNISCSQHTTDTIVHNQDDVLKNHPSKVDSKRQKSFSKLRKVNENETFRGVIDNLRLGSDGRHSKSLNGKYFKCPRKNSMATTTSLTSLTGNENDNGNNETSRIMIFCDASKTPSPQTEKPKTSKIAHNNQDEDEF